MSRRKPKVVTLYMREDEKVLLEKYAETVNKSQAEVIREFVRSLSKLTDCNSMNGVTHTVT